ncbi:MAG: hypothetical protein JJ894_05585 [Dinoroseobacter sp.]|nr:hypothetical protein [Dinoroseobacter sp.]
MVKGNSKVTFVWFAVTVGVSITFCMSAYSDPSKFASIVDLLSAIISILVGVSLAVVAVLVVPVSIAKKHLKDQFEAQRMNNIVSNDDEALVVGQIVVFMLFFAALFGALVFKWLYDPSVQTPGNFVKISAGVGAFLGVFSFLWSARLPFLLVEVAKQRRHLGNP